MAHAAGALLVARLPAQPAALLLALARLVALLLRAPRRRAHHRRAKEVAREVGPHGEHERLVLDAGAPRLAPLEGTGGCVRRGLKVTHHTVPPTS